MKTLLQITLEDSGIIRLYSEEELCPADRQHYMEKAIAALYQEYWHTNDWVRLFGFAQQALDLGTATMMVDPWLLTHDEWDPDEEDDYYGTDDDSQELFERWNRNAEPEPDPILERKKDVLKTALSEWREQKAARLGIPNYEVLKHTVLDGIARRVPTTEEELMKVRCFGSVSFARHGEEILALANEVSTRVEAEYQAQVADKTAQV